MCLQNKPGTHAQNNDNSGQVNVFKYFMSYPTHPILFALCQSSFIHFYSFPCSVSKCHLHLHLLLRQTLLLRAKPAFPTVYSIYPKLNSMHCFSSCSFSIFLSLPPEISEVLLSFSLLSPILSKLINYFECICQELFSYP